MRITKILDREAKGRRDHDALAFDDFVLDLDRQMLFRRGVEVHLRPKAFELLVYLAHRPGVLNTPDEILDAVWGDVVTGKNSVSQCLIEIRRALGDETHTKIRTIPRKGIIFDMDVRTIAVGRNETEASHSGSHSFRRPSWAVIAAASGIVATLLLFLLTPDGVDSPPIPTKAEQYIRIAEQLTHRRGSGNLERAAELFRKALALDPDSEDALVGLASALVLSESVHKSIPKPEGDEIERTLDRALALNPRNPVAHLRLAQYLYLTGNSETADEHMALAARYGPDEPLVLTSTAARRMREGDVHDALELQERAIALVPDRASYQINYASMLFNAGQMERAREAYRNASILSPEIAEELRYPLARIAIALGEREQAESLGSRLADSVERDIVTALLSAPTDGPEGRKAVERLRHDGSAAAALGLAEWSAMRGQSDEAYSWLDTGIERLFEEHRWRGAAHRALLLRYSPFLRSLKGDEPWREWIDAVADRASRP